MCLVHMMHKAELVTYFFTLHAVFHLYQNRQSELGNLVLRHSVPVKKLPFLLLKFRVVWWNLTSRFASFVTRETSKEFHFLSGNRTRNLSHLQSHASAGLNYLNVASCGTQRAAVTRS